jgi:hypothetical protein
MKEKLKHIFDVYGAPAICLLVGLVFLFTGIGKAKKINVFPTAPAEIVDIEIIPGAADETDTYRVTVRYAVGGTIYESQTDDHKGNWYVGKQITVHYNPEKPQQIVAMSTFTAILITAFGGLFAAVGAWLWIRLLREKLAARQSA